jgi:hypothetical protein
METSSPANNAMSTQDDVYNQNVSQEVPQMEDQTIRIKQEPIDPDEQILIQNNQTQQVTLINNAPVITNIQKVVPPVSRNTNTGTNPSSMVTVYVQSTPTVPGVEAKKAIKVLKLLCFFGFFQ